MRYVIIGIVSHDDDHPTYQEGYVDALQLKFFDVDFDMMNFRGMIYPSIQPLDAVKILEFTEKNKNSIDLIVVHCNAGISRSSGTAAALSLIYNQDDSWVFKNPRYMPNMLVRKTILNEAEKMGLLDE